uniref:Protein kinase domain-containing protein n=2 Tax=Zea mays TaxID=4577 RepID=A0A804U7H1_MAIZE
MCAPSAVREARLRAAAKLEKDTGRHYSAAEEKIERTPRDCVEAAGSSLKHSSNGGIVVGGSEAQQEQPLQLRSASFTLFTVASLQQHTGGFSRQDLVRETCFGKIYAADRPTGSKLSVLKLDSDAARTPVPEFLEAVRGVAGLRHPNVEQLVGCCVEHGQRLLVYRHFSDRALDGVLRLEHGASTSGPDENETLRWDARVAVALEAAKALEYLHEGAGKQVVHRHFRPEHVLVDGELRVSVSGCGLAPLVAERSDCCGVATSYEPPEAGGGAAWTPKGDVYSFGVVMLQLLTGRRPYDGARARGERRLVPWASARLYDLAALRKMADPRLGAPPPVRSLSRFADVISRCIQPEAEFRPAMSQVAQDLRRTLENARAVTGTGSGGSAQV